MPQQTPAQTPLGAPPAARQFSVPEFAGLVRRKYTADHGRDPYADLPDDQLTHAYLQKYPQYQDLLGGPGGVDVLAGFEGIDTSRPDPRVQQVQRQAEGQLAEHEGLTAAARGMETSIMEDLEPPSPIAGPIGMLIGAVSPKAKSYLNVPQRGAVQAASGLARAAGVPFGVTSPAGLMPAGSDVIEGSMAAGTAALPAAALAAPAATAMGILVGMGGQYGVRKVAEASGADPETTRFAENVGGLVAGGLGAEATSLGITAARARIQNASDSAAWAAGARRARPVPPEPWHAALHRETLPEILAQPGVREAAARMPKTTPDLASVVGQPPPPPVDPARVAAAGRAVKATPGVRPDRKGLAQTLEQIKAGVIDPKDRTLSAFERAAAAVYQRTGTLTIEDLGTIYDRFQQVGRTVSQGTQAPTIGQPPPGPLGTKIGARPPFDPARALPPAGTSVVGGVEQSILDPALQAKLDQPPRFIAVDPTKDPLRYDFTRGQVVVGEPPPTPSDPMVDAFGDYLAQAIDSAAPGQGRLVPDAEPTLRLRRQVAEPPPPPQSGQAALPGVKGRKPKLKFGKPIGEPPPAAFDQGASPAGVDPQTGQMGLPIDPAYRMRLGEIQRRANARIQQRYKYVYDENMQRKRVPIEGSGEPGPQQAHLDELKQDELTEVGRMLVAMESSEFTPKSIDFQEDAVRRSSLADPHVVGRSPGHPVYWEILRGDAETGNADYGHYSRAEVTAALRNFLHHGKRSIVSDLAVDLARKSREMVPSEIDGMAFESPRGHSARDVPEDFARAAAKLPEGPGFSPIGERVAGEQLRGPQLPGAEVEDLPDWVTERQPGEVELPQGQGAQQIGEPPPRATRGRPNTPGRVPSALDDPEILNAERDVPLPGAEQVRETERPTPEFEAPFSLGQEIGQPPPGVQESLFGEPPPKAKPTKGRSASGLDNPRLFDAADGPGNPRHRAGFVVSVGKPDAAQPATVKAFRRWLNGKRSEFYAEPWYEAAETALAAGEPAHAWRIAAVASGEPPTAFGNARRAGQVGQPPPSETGRMGETTTGPGGLLVPPRTVPNLDPKHTDLLLGHTMLRSTLETVDHLADGVVLVRGNEDPALRLNRQVVSGMLQEARAGKGELKKLAKLLGQKPEQVARHLMRQATQAGRVLNAWSQFYNRNIDAFTFLEKAGIDSSGLDPKAAMAMAQDPKVQARVRAAERVAATARTLGILVEGNGPRARVDRLQLEHALAGDRNKVYMGLLNDVENFSRALIVSQPVTSIRNFWTQTARYSVGALDHVLSAPVAAITGDLPAARSHLLTAAEMVKAPFRKGTGVTPARAISDTMQAVYDFTDASLRAMSPRDARKTLGVLDKFPQLAAEYMGSAAGDLAPGKGTPAEAKGLSKALATIASPKVRNVITALNRSAEFSQRSVVFDSIFRAGLRQRGIDPNRLLVEDFSTIAKRIGARELEELTAGAMHAALDYTFASKPLYNSIPGRLLKIMSDIPVVSPLLRTGYPFPRFNLVAAPRFIYDHSPAALLDILRLPIDALTGGNAPKGRLYLGTQAAKIQRDALPRMEFEVKRAEAKHGIALQAWAAARIETAKLAKRYKTIEARAKTTGSLKGMEAEYGRVVDGLQSQIAARDDAKMQVRTTKHEWRELIRQRGQLEQQVRRAKSISAPTFHEFMGRQATGLALLGAALAVRQSEGAKGTQWYEYRVGKRTIDFRAFAPFVQYLLVADWMNDLHHETDWDQVRGAAAGKLNPIEWADAVGKHYHGKYTSPTMTKQVMQAFLSMSQAAGTTLSLVDLVTGDQTSQGILSDVYNGVLGSMGQFIGRFTTPLQAVNDVVGQFSEEDRKARIPEEPVEGNRHEFDQLAGPTVAKIPGARRSLPEKINPMSGQPIATVDPLARQFAGITQRERSGFEQELARVGLPWFKATPRQVGDREFDNATAKAYHEGLAKFVPQVLSNPAYQKMPTDLKRETLQGVLSDLKAYAYMQVARQQGVKATAEKLARPSEKARAERWKGFLKTLREDLPPATPEPPGEIGAPPPAGRGPGG